MIYSRTISLLFCLALAACASTPSPEDSQMAASLGAQGKALLANGKNAEALDVYLSAISRDDQNPRLWNGLGASYEMLGKRDQAQTAYRRALDIAPNDRAAANNLAHLSMEEGDPAAAVVLLAAYKEDHTAPKALKQNLARAEKAAYAKESLNNDVYADLGTAPTEGMAKGRVTEAKAILGDDAKDLSFHVVPELKIAGGTPVFTVKVVGRDPQSICDDLSPKAFPCLPHGK